MNQDGWSAAALERSVFSGSKLTELCQQNRVSLIAHTWSVDTTREKAKVDKPKGGFFGRRRVPETGRCSRFKKGPPSRRPANAISGGRQWANLGPRPAVVSRWSAREPLICMRPTRPGRGGEAPLGAVAPCAACKPPQAATSSPRGKAPTLSQHNTQK